MSDTFTIRDEEINIEEIMESIRQNLRENGLAEDPLLMVNTSRIDNKEFYKQLDKVNNYVNYLSRSLHLTGDREIRSHRAIIGKPIVFGKKVLRKMIRWYTKPVWDQQTEINSHSVRAFNEIMIVLEKLIEQNARLSSKVLHLQDKSDDIQNIDRPKEKLDIDYFDFEMKFRGTREEIKKRQSIYLQFFAGKKNVLDLGCGRGEFTELLLENDVPVKGIDLNEAMVTFCKDKGLPVMFDDIFDYLEEVSDQSLGGVFLGQVIEHLSAARFVELVKLCHRKLEHGAYFVAETPNPECLAIFAQSFYLDFTHVKPVHPLGARFVLESHGFKDAQLIYSSPMPDEYHLPKDFENSSLDSKTMVALRNWNRVLFGNQDYAIIGRK